jgi:hypothetical protein
MGEAGSDSGTMTVCPALTSQALHAAGMTTDYVHVRDPQHSHLCPPIHCSW